MVTNMSSTNAASSAPKSLTVAHGWCSTGLPTTVIGRTEPLLVSGSSPTTVCGVCRSSTWTASTCCSDMPLAFTPYRDQPPGYGLGPDRADRPVPASADLFQIPVGPPGP